MRVEKREERGRDSHREGRLGDKTIRERQTDISNPESVWWTIPCREAEDEECKGGRKEEERRGKRGTEKRKCIEEGKESEKGRQRSKPGGAGSPSSPTFFLDWQPEAVLGCGHRAAAEPRQESRMSPWCVYPLISSLVINNMTLEVRRQLILIFI